MKKILLVAAISAIVSGTAFAGVTVNDYDAASAQALASTGASGIVTSPNGYATSGAAMNTTGTAQANADLLREPHASASGSSATNGSSSAAILGAGTAGAGFTGGTVAKATDQTGIVSSTPAFWIFPATTNVDKASGQASVETFTTGGSVASGPFGITTFNTHADVNTTGQAHADADLQPDPNASAGATGSSNGHASQLQGPGWFGTSLGNASSGGTTLYNGSSSVYAIDGSSIGTYNSIAPPL